MLKRENRWLVLLNKFERSNLVKVFRIAEPFGVIATVVAVVVAITAYREESGDRDADRLVRAEIRDMLVHEKNLRAEEARIRRLTAESLAWTRLGQAREESGFLGQGDVLKILFELRGGDLNGIDLRGQSVFDAVLVQGNFVCSDFRDTTLKKIVFAHSKLMNSSFRNARLIDVDFGGADLTGVDFGDSEMINVKFDDAELSYTNFSGVDLTNTIGVEKRQIEEACFFEGYIPIEGLDSRDPSSYPKLLNDCGIDTASEKVC